MSKNLAKWLLKLGLTVLALWLLSRKIEWSEVTEVLKTVNLFWLLIALGLYVLSKVISAVRLNQIQKQIPIEFDDKKNIKLYFIGMFYNLFLPGGIGGDGYKGFYLKRHFQQPLKKIISALFLDRFYGLAALFLLLFSGLLISQELQEIGHIWHIIAIILLILVLPVTWLIIRVFFKDFLPPFTRVISLSLLVQVVQLICAWCILQALGVTDQLINYLSLFLASSIAAVLPISIGGVGVRELVFVYGQDYFNIGKNEAVAFSLLFFVVSAISSFFGAFLSMDKNDKAS